MAKFNLSASKTVAELKKEFNEAFGSVLKVYNKNKIADDAATLGELGLKADTEFECRANRTAGSFIAAFAELGLKVKIYTQDEWVAVLDGLTLEATGKVKKNATKADMEGMEGYQREDSTSENSSNLTTADTDTKVVCHTEILENFRIQDMTDDWRINFLDDEMELLDEDIVLRLKDDLFEYIKTISYETNNGGTVNISNDFDLDIDEQTIITIDQYNFPGAGETTVEYVEKTLGAILTFARNNDINVVASMILNGTHYGNDISAFECGALVNGVSSCFEFAAYQQENDDEELEYVDDEDNIYDIDTVVEILNDRCNDNFEGTAFEMIDGDITERGEDHQEKIYDIIGKTVFPYNY